MSKQDKKEVAAPAVKIKPAGKALTRHRRNMFQRKCLSKAMKRMFSDVPSSVRRMLVTFEQRNKARTTA